MHFGKVAYITNVIVLAGTWSIDWNLKQSTLGIVSLKTPEAESNNTSTGIAMCSVQFGLWFFTHIVHVQLPLK